VSAFEQRYAAIDDIEVLAQAIAAACADFGTLGYQGLLQNQRSGSAMVPKRGLAVRVEKIRDNNSKRSAPEEMLHSPVTDRPYGPDFAGLLASHELRGADIGGRVLPDCRAIKLG
jgi:hypothetical protein